MVRELLSAAVMLAGLAFVSPDGQNVYVGSYKNTSEEGLAVGDGHEAAFVHRDRGLGMSVQL